MTDLQPDAFRIALDLKWAIFLLKTGDKVPQGGHGHLDASPEADVARARWSGRNAACNIGCATGAPSKVWVLDIDPKNGGIEAMKELVALNGALPKNGIISRTPSGGWHFFFIWPPDASFRCSTNKVGDGIDVRAAGGYVCVPPSARPDGSYVWIRSPFDHPLTAAPGWLMDIVAPPGVMPWYNPDLEIPEVFRRQPETLQPAKAPAPTMPDDIGNYVSTAVDSELDELRGATPGTRNTALNKCAFAVFGFAKAGAVPVDWARATLTDIALNIGLETLEVGKTLASAWGASTARNLDDH